MQMYMRVKELAALAEQPSPDSLKKTILLHLGSVVLKMQDVDCIPPMTNCVHIIRVKETGCLRDSRLLYFLTMFSWLKDKTDSYSSPQQMLIPDNKVRHVISLSDASFVGITAVHHFLCGGERELQQSVCRYSCKMHYLFVCLSCHCSLTLQLTAAVGGSLLKVLQCSSSHCTARVVFCMLSLSSFLWKYAGHLSASVFWKEAVGKNRLRGTTTNKRIIKKNLCTVSAAAGSVSQRYVLDPCTSCNYIIAEVCGYVYKIVTLSAKPCSGSYWAFMVLLPQVY